MPRPPFPHMMPHDIPLFAAFVLSDEGKKFNRWEFDVHVGQGQDPGPVFEPNLRFMSLILTKLRIDAVGWEGNHPTIFEVKPDARLSALGQVIGYCHFFTKEFGVACKTAIITDTTTPDIRELYENHGITLHLVEPATNAQIARAARIAAPGRAAGLVFPSQFLDEEE